MTINVGNELAALRRMTVKELRGRFAEVFGEETRARNKAWLVKLSAAHVASGGSLGLAAESGEGVRHVAG